MKAAIMFKNVFWHLTGKIIAAPYSLERKWKSNQGYSTYLNRTIIGNIQSDAEKLCARQNMRIFMLDAM